MKTLNFALLFYSDLNVHSFIASALCNVVENVESEALEAVARWSVIGKVVSF